MSTVLISRKSVFPPSVHMEAAAFAKVIGTRLWKTRMARKENPEVVAKALKISPKLLDKIENGRYNFPLKILFRLCEYYDVDPDEIVLGKKGRRSRIKAN
mgnify:CR=1 FL=1|jgi:Uncharacterized protein conserved in bacteria